MVKTAYPAQWRYINKWSVVSFGLWIWIPLMTSITYSHLTWKKGKIERYTHNDSRFLGQVNQRGFRMNYLQKAQLEAYPDQQNYTFDKTIKQYLKLRSHYFI